MDKKEKEKYSQNRFIEIAKDHFETMMLPQLTAISEEAVNHMLVFVEGSVAYGFCDEKSDVDIDYYINTDADESTRQQIRELFTGETYWHKGVRVSYGFGGKYWKFDLLINDAMDQFWEEFDPYALKNITLAVPLWDPEGILVSVQKKVSFYPENLRKKIIRGLWLTVKDSGEYNFNEAVKRNKLIEGRIYQYRALEAMMRLAYILNDQYFYPTKWLSAGLDQLQEDFGLKDALRKISVLHDAELEYAEYMIVFERIRLFMIQNESIEEECIEDYGTIFRKPFQVFKMF